MMFKDLTSLKNGKEVQEYLDSFIGELDVFVSTILRLIKKRINRFLCLFRGHQPIQPTKFLRNGEWVKGGKWCNLCSKHL